MTTESLRRIPSQPRAEARIDAILAAASAVIAEGGYEAATLTAVAVRAKTSIGSLYQYFPDKAAIAAALAARHGMEIADRWEACMKGVSAETSPRDFVARMMAMATAFMHERPSYLPLAADMPGYRHNLADRHRLRACIEAAVLARWPTVDAARAAVVAEVTVGVIRALGISLSNAHNNQHGGLVTEYQEMLVGYYRSLSAQ